MPIDTRFRDRAQEWIAAGMLVVALGGSWYLVSDDVTADLEFVDVGWWNIRDLSSNSRDDDEIEQIAESIEATGVEVLAVGELNDLTSLPSIAAELGGNWRSDATPNKIGRSAHTAEHYGFLWNSNEVELVGSIHVDPDPGDRFDREPAWATFRTTDTNFDFTVIAVHITWGQTVPPRKAEIRSLLGVWNRVQQATTNDDDLILVGDFNRNVGDDSFDQLLSVSGMLCANQDTIPTKISSNNTYDQIFLSTNETVEWTGEYDTLAFDEVFFDNDDHAAKLAVSDHRPVWITLFVPDSDDD